jgi:drug/metabolite transporter (DMT)-like permease
MLYGVTFMGKHYRAREYMSVAVMVTGLVLFLEADASSPAVFSLMGVLLMIACVFMDCCYTNLSEVVLKRYDASPEEVSVCYCVLCLNTHFMVSMTRVAKSS